MSTAGEPSPASEPLEADTAGPTGGADGDASLEVLVREVAERVIRELRDRGVRIAPAEGSAESRTPAAVAECGRPPGRAERVDMSAYRTPVLTERHVRKLHPLASAVAVPRGTVVSPGAKELLRDRNIELCNE